MAEYNARIFLELLDSQEKTIEKLNMTQEKQVELIDTLLKTKGKADELILTYEKLVEVLKKRIQEFENDNS